MGENKSRIPYVNIIIIALNVIYFLYIETAGSSEDLNFMVKHGAMYAPYVIEDGQYYRLFTSMFMHFGIEHIANNMLFLFLLGDNLERALGKVKYIIFYIICGVGANIASMLLNVNGYRTVISAGASGAIFGVIGGLLYAVIINRGRLEDLSTRQLIVLILLSLFFGYTSTGVDNTAHVAGLIIGFILAAIIYRRPENKYKDKETDYEGY